MDQNLANSIDQLEKAVIGCIFNKCNLIEQTYITEEYFSNNYNKLVFKLAIEYYRKKKNLDILLFYQEYMDKLGGDFVIYMDSCQDIGTFTVNYDYYQDKLLEIYKNRLIVLYVNKFINKQLNQEELYEYLEKIKAIYPNKKYEFLSAEEIYHIITKLDKQIKFRLSSISNTIKLTEHDFIVIGARPGVGKTGFAINLLEDISKKYKCLYFNMEMSEQQILRRLVSIISKIPMNDLTKLPNPEYQNKVIKDTVNDIANRKIKIYTGTQTTNYIKQIIARESKEEHVVVFIDYIGLLGGQSKKSEYESTTANVKELRQISMNLDCTIIGLAQVNRNAESKSVPTLQDLKSTGELEQSAVAVILLHNENADKKISKDKEELEVIVAKNRNGKTGHVTVYYDQNNQQIYEKAKYL